MKKIPALVVSWTLLAGLAGLSGCVSIGSKGTTKLLLDRVLFRNG